MKHGLALCCGETPVNDSTYPQKFTCSKCNKTKGVWGGDVTDAARIWNQSCGTTKPEYNPEPQLDLPNWRYCDLRYTRHLPYNKPREIELPFTLFQLNRTQYELTHGEYGWENIIDDVRCFKQFKLRSYNGVEVEFDLPSFKKKHADPFQVYVCVSSCTDGSCWYSMFMTTHNMKWNNIFIEKLETLYNKKIELDCRNEY